MNIRSPRELAEENSDLIQDIKLARAQIKDLQEEVEELKRELAEANALIEKPESTNADH